MSGIAFTRPKLAPTFGPRAFTKFDAMGIRFADGDGTDDKGAGAGGDENKDDKGGDKYTAPATQAELDTLKAASATDQDKAIQAAEQKVRDELTNELNQERVLNALERKLEGRTLNSPRALLDLDRKQFIKDGKVDAEAIETWVKANTAETPAPKSKDKAQGNRDSTAGGGSVQAGREAYEARRGKKSTTSNS